MKVGDLVRHRDSQDIGLIIEDQEDNDGLYLVHWVRDSSDGYFDNKDVEVLNEGGRFSKDRLQIHESVDSQAV